MTTDVLIYGGGAGGICAAIQAARLGARVLVVEPTSWVGGMLTAAGVSALDGNKHALGGGLVHTFRSRLADHYGSLDALHTGWISLYCYEPRVGHRILRDLAEAEPTLTLWMQSEVVAYTRRGSRERTVQVRRADGGVQAVSCAVFVDATEYGDGLALAGLPYRLGREARDDLGESAAPERADQEIQDLTYVATLVHEHDPARRHVPEVTDADRAYWAWFDCSTRERCSKPDRDALDHDLHDWESFLSYGLLPNGKFMLNWPHHANDFPAVPALYEDRYVRRQYLAAARLHTLQYVKYLQTALGHPEWQLATDEYPTPDHLPLIPYIRESRRLVNAHVMRQDDVVPRPGMLRAPRVLDAIAVGDYFLDHHHAKAFLPPGERLEEAYPDNAPFQVPVTVVLTEDDPCFLAGEKNIAVSHIVNGCTRLQPVVMLMGQAIGALAALAVAQGVEPGAVSVETVQDVLIDAGCQIYPVYDVPPGHPLFRVVQDLARRGILREEDPLYLEPEAPLSPRQARIWAERAGLSVPEAAEPGTCGAFLAHLHAAR
ncbi:MAG: FAD-dependent oxidoreductase [Bacteroidetes bacterium]|nr:MAG: FAD-dependent oxidoreductase [Bacteroidota bacterium]